MTETPQRPEILHPRAVRMGLERVIEHQRVALQETATLAQLYDAHLRPDHPLEVPLNPRLFGRPRYSWISQSLCGRCMMISLPQAPW